MFCAPSAHKTSNYIFNHQNFSRPQLKDEIVERLISGGMIQLLISQVFDDFEEHPEEQRIFKPNHILNTLVFLYKKCYPS